MKKFALALLAAVIVSLGLAPAANAYPDPVLTVSVSDSTVAGGSSFTVSASSDTPCTYNATFNGTSKTGTGTSFSASFTTPEVSSTTRIPVSVTCDSQTGSATRSVTITVLPPESQGGNAPSGLASTGGPSSALLGGGLMLVLVGAFAVVVARRRAA